MHSRKLALSLAKQYRTCPPARVREDSSHGEEYARHLAQCPYCQAESAEEREAWNGLSQSLWTCFGSSLSSFGEKGIGPGQLRFLRKELAGWLDGFYYNPPMVIVMEVTRAVSDDLLVCQTYHDTALAGPGDLVLEDPDTGLGDLFLESWNIYTLKASDLGPWVGEVPPETVSAVRALGEDPNLYPGWAVMPRPISGHDPRRYFRQLEVEVGYFFASASVAQLMDELGGQGLRLVYSSAGELSEAVEKAMPGTCWPFRPRTREEALAMAELPLEELPLAAEDRELETGTATLFMLRQGAVTGVKPLVLQVYGRSGGLKISGRISGLPKGVFGSDLVCLLDVGKESPLVPTRYEWREETGDFLAEFEAGEGTRGRLRAAVLCEIGGDGDAGT